MAEDASWTFSLASHSLADLLAEARHLTRTRGQRHATQRGATYSANRVALTWLAPQSTGEAGLPWRQGDVRWYLDIFVEKHERSDPLWKPPAGSLLFPYTYAARARFWDAGWAHLQRLLEGITAHDFSLAQAARSSTYFTEMVLRLADRLHVQTVLSLMSLFPPPLLAHYLAHPEVARGQAAAWRRDLLAGAIADVAALPQSRRAVVGPLTYPQLEGQLQPQMALPPYQLFQLLPAEPAAPLSSIHEHRSLDVVGGAQLDFAHDLAWLNEAALQVGRSAGDITIVAHNLHEYEDLARADEPSAAPMESEIERWLCRVTDGYRSEAGVPARLLRQPAYASNAERIARQWSTNGV